MIEVRATITILAEDDEQADDVYRALHAVNRTWPELPVVNIAETSREGLEVTTDVPDTIDVLSVVRLVHDAIHDLDVDGIVNLTPADALTAFAVLEDANRVFQQIRSLLVGPLAEKMGEHQITVDGVGTFVRHVKKNRTQWDKESLLRAVLDSRLVDEHTGEVADESPLDRVLAVWNLGAPRTTVLKARNIDADEYAHVERGGWTIELVTS